jgi:Tol biopolymer transport system component/tRNA A-37 threonylcarbamoyl transferase component Bud32
MTLTPGTRLGPYEILSPLGAGGMGEVYKARDTKLRRLVAVKVLPEEVASDQERLRRFEREAEAVAALSHPNVLSIFDFGREGPVAYAVTELLEGETLREKIDRGPIAVRRAIGYGAAIAEGLSTAHASGIVHRDLKPENVFVTREERVKILDFGLAKSMPAEKEKIATQAPTAAPATEAGVVMGTVGYMSPEQVRGLPVDSRSDIFSFGATLFEMLTGKRAFQRATTTDTLSAVLRDEPPPLEDAGAVVPAELDRIVRHCLEKSPEARFQSARDLAFALESISASGPTAGAASGLGAAPSAARGLSVRERAIWIAAVMALGAGLAFVALSSRGRPASTVARFTIPPPDGTSYDGMLALSPDGSTLAFVATTADGHDQLWIRSLDSVTARLLPDTDGAAYPFWSPDGRWLAFFARRKLKKIEIAGGSVQTLCSASDPRGGSWSSRGTIVFSEHVGGELASVPDSGGEPASVRSLTAADAESLRWPTFLPDGRHFLFFVLSANPKVAGIHVGSLDSTTSTRLVSADSGALFAEPDRLFYRQADRLMSQSFDPRRLSLTGEARPVLEGIRWDSLATLATAATVSLRGDLAYESGGFAKSRLLWYDRAGRELGTAGPPGAYIEPALSPNGKWLAVTRADPATLSTEVWLLDLERSQFRRAVLNPDFFSSTPVWSSDGERIAFAVYPTGEVYVKSAFRAEPEKLLYRSSSFSPLDDWSADGSLLFLTAIDWKAFHTDIGVRDLRAGSSRLLLKAAFDETGGQLSPDGHWLAFQSTESGEPEIYVQGFPEGGERVQVSAGGGTQAKWRGDGRELFYVSPDRKIVAADVRTTPKLEVGAPHALFQTQILPLIEARNHYDVTRDGQRFLVNSRLKEDSSLPITVVLQRAVGPR